MCVFDIESMEQRIHASTTVSIKTHALNVYYNETARLAITAVFCPGLKNGMVLLEEKIFKKGTFVREITF